MCFNGQNKGQGRGSWFFHPGQGCHPQWRHMAAVLGLPMLPVTRLTVTSPLVLVAAVEFSNAASPS